MVIQNWIRRKKSWHLNAVRTPFTNTQHKGDAKKRIYPISISTKKWNERITVMSGQGKLDISNTQKKYKKMKRRKKCWSKQVILYKIVALFLLFSPFLYSKHSYSVPYELNLCIICYTIIIYYYCSYYLYFLYNNHHFFFLVFTGSNSISYKKVIMIILFLYFAFFLRNALIRLLLYVMFFALVWM